MKSLSTHLVSENCWVFSQLILAVVDQVAGWPVCASDKWGDFGYVSIPDVIYILKSELLKTLCKIIDIILNKTLYRYEG